jgi:membrane-associated protein
MPARRFALWNVVGGLLWTIGLVLLGHGLGHIGVVRRHIEVLVLVVVVLSVVPILFELTRRSRTRPHPGGQQADGGPGE